jgi:hypothetical protein
MSKFEYNLYIAVMYLLQKAEEKEDKDLKDNYALARLHKDRLITSANEDWSKKDE